jgi:hypothetical protein
MQACLSRLYVDTCFRALFYINPVDTMNGYNLTTEERSAIRGVDRQKLEFFASSLRQKRREKLQCVYPALFALKSRAVDLLYQRYYDLHIATPYHGPQEDVISFGLFIEESLANAAGVPRYASDLAKYERLYYCSRLEWNRIDDCVRDTTGILATSDQSVRVKVRNRVLIAAFHYNIAHIAEALQTGNISPGHEIDEDEHIIAFVPRIGRSNAKMLRLTPATKTLLDLCNGHRPLGMIIEMAESRFGTGNITEDVLATLTRMLELGVLESQPAEEQLNIY